MDTTNRRRIQTGLLARSAWGALFLIHAPIIAAVASSIASNPAAADRLASLAALVAVTAIFLLKTLDVPWLRIGTPRQTFWIALISAALVHHEALGSDQLTAPAAVVVAATGVEAARHAPRLTRILRDVLAIRPPATLSPAGLVTTERFVRPSPFDIPSLRSRGPPRDDA